MFEKASRNKIRFKTEKGSLSVEELWDLPLTSNRTNLNLDNIAIELHNEIKEGSEISFVKKDKHINDRFSENQLKFDIVRHIIDVKIEEQDRDRKSADNKKRKQRLLEIAARKRDEADENKSIEEIMDMINSIEE